MGIIEFVKQILINNRFKESHIDELLESNFFLSEEDFPFYEVNKSKSVWKTRLFKKLNMKSFPPQSENYWIFRGYSDLETRDFVNSSKVTRKDPTPMQKEFWILKGLSEKESIYKIRSFRKTNVEYWESRGFSPDESVFKIKEYQKENSEKLKRKKEEKPELFEDVGWNQKKYWIKKGMSEEESIRKISELQKTFSLESCIEKYGKEEGKKKWLDRQEKWKAKVFNEFTNIARGTSKMSSDFINDLINRINFNGTFLYDKEEKFINCPQRNRSFKYDFTYTERKKIIEINGDFWHCNPEIFKDDSQIHKVTNKSVKDIREMDNHKINLAEKHGYSVFCIWESDIRKKREDSLNKCLEFLKS
jgi:G:T-mismatch repair DNA endonuclease (very short patch repair protein)